jgi:histidinol-phosphate aminotransferase
MDVRTLIRKEVLGQKAYAVDLSECPVKLDANENPHSLSPAAAAVLHAAIRDVALNRYPDPEARKLRDRLSALYGVPREMILTGNGSDELIQILLAVLRPGGEGGGVLLPVPTFAMYGITAANMGHRVIEVPLDENFDLPRGFAGRWVKGENPDIVFLAYPNNPTGNCFSRGKMEEVLDAAGGFVVVDEAYGHFSGKTFLPEVKRRENLVILRTFSKVGFAAIRLGVLIGSPDLLGELNKVRLPYNLNALTQAVGTRLLDHGEELDRQVRDIVGGRKELFRELKKVEGIHPFPSDANFILFRCAYDKDRVYKGLVERGVLVKAFAAPQVLRNCFRVSVGTKEENRAFVAALRDVVGACR